MTASTRPVDGPRTDRVGTSDRKHGAGLLNAAVAVSLANPSYAVQPNNPAAPRGVQGRSADFATDFPNGRLGPYNVLTTMNGRLRAVVAWDATAQGCDPAKMDGSGCIGVLLDGDLDLYVSRWNGSSYVPVCWSTSYDSSWELCDLPVSAGELYKVEVAKASVNSTGTYMGIAWNNYDPNAE